MAQAKPHPFDLILAGRVHIAGGLATTIPDVPLSCVLMLFFIAGAVLNVRLFLKYGKQLKWQMALFGFCMARIVTMIMRIVWSQRQTNENIAIAAIVFLNAGVIIIFLINMMMCKKALFRTHYHYFQEHPAQKKLVKAIFSALGFLLLAFLIILIVGAVQGFLTTDPSIMRIDTILKRMGTVVFMVYCCLPFFILAFNAIWRLRTGPPGSASYHEGVSEKAPLLRRTKSWDTNRAVWINSLIILFSASMVIIEYGIKLEQSFANAQVDAWYFRKGAFYGLAIVPEILALYTLIFANMAERYSGLSPMKAGDVEEQKQPETA